MQSSLCTLLVWWAVPLTVVAFWWRYTHRHDVIGAVWLILMAAAAIHLAQASTTIARHTLRAQPLPAFRWIQHCITAGVVVCLWTLTMLAVKTGGPTLFLDANLVNANLSVPPQDWSGLTATLPESRENTFDLVALNFAAAITEQPIPQETMQRWHGDPHANLKAAKEVEQTSRRLYRHVRGAQLRNANLKGANLIGAFLGRASLSDANLRSAMLSSADLGWARLNGAALTDVQMWNGTLIGADLSQADLGDGTFSNCIFIGADLSGALLMDTYLTNSDFCRADLRGAYLNEANFSFARFTGANFTNARLAGADFSGADLRGTIGLRKTQLIRAKTDQRTLLPEFDDSGISIPLDAQATAPTPVAAVNAPPNVPAGQGILGAAAAGNTGPITAWPAPMLEALAPPASEEEEPERR